MSSETAKKIFSKFDDAKTLPHVAIRIIQLINNERTTLQDFEDIIHLDPVLLTRLLRLVNSAYFGLYEKVNSVSKAIVFVGMDNLRNLVAVETLKTLFKDEGEEGAFSRKKVWFHSATVAILSQMIARRMFGNIGSDYFLAGILHDIGIIVEDQVVGKKLRQLINLIHTSNMPFLELENDVIGTDHCKIGGLVAEKLKLDPSLGKAIVHHHSQEDKITPGSLNCVIQISDYIACNLKYSPFDGMSELSELSPALKNHIKRQARDYRVIIKDLPEQMAKAKELYEIED